MHQATLPTISAADLTAGGPARAAAVAAIGRAAKDVGFFLVENTAIPARDVEAVLHLYRRFFALPVARKALVDMRRTGSNRGWAPGGSEQVDPTANPDYKEVFDCGWELPPDHPRASDRYYAPNQWPDEPPGFRDAILTYFRAAAAVALDLLRAVAEAMGQPPDHFAAAFEEPMALLRANHYPARPEWATARDFGIAPHTDYGCLTLLATDGAPGLEVQTRDGGWIPVSAPPGVFVVNFGEMIEMWTGGAVRATPHRVVGTAEERLSIPLFFNPASETNVAPIGSGKIIRAGDHLTRRYDATYVHRQGAAATSPRT